MLVDNSDAAGFGTYLASVVILMVSVGLALFMTFEDAKAAREQEQDGAEAFADARNKRGD